ncbi:MAG: hypothetical protein CMI63_21355 [Parvularcula sp.]|nr:hypothetical protein [Parvularcula sp.]
MKNVMTKQPTSIRRRSASLRKLCRPFASLALCAAAIASPAAAAAVSCPGYESQSRQESDHEAFIRAYIDCFNNQDFACLDRVYADDLRYEGQHWTLSSKEEFFTFYRKAWEHLSEHITVLNVRSEGDKAFVDLQNRIDVFKSYPDFPSRPLMAGDVLNLEGTVAYTIKNNKISHICDR